MSFENQQGPLPERRSEKVERAKFMVNNAIIELQRLKDLLEGGSVDEAGADNISARIYKTPVSQLISDLEFEGVIPPQQG